jgi:hypothetical protein
MISDASSPQSYHTPKWNENAEEIGEQEHGLGFELEVSLYVPKAEGGCD